MDRKFIDCRDYPSESGCSIAISADSEDELVEAAAQHAVVQDMKWPELRAMLRQGVKSGAPAA